MLPDVLKLATRYATWMHRTVRLHRLVTEVVTGTSAREVPGNGSVILVVPAAAWLALEEESHRDLPSLGDETIAPTSPDPTHVALHRLLDTVSAFLESDETLKPEDELSPEHRHMRDVFRAAAGELGYTDASKVPA